MEREAEGGGLRPEGGKIEARNSPWLGTRSFRALTVTPTPTGQRVAPSRAPGLAQPSLLSYILAGGGGKHKRKHPLRNRQLCLPHLRIYIFLKKSRNKGEGRKRSEERETGKARRQTSLGS